MKKPRENILKKIDGTENLHVLIVIPKRLSYWNVTTVSISEALKSEKIEQLTDPKGKFTEGQIAIKEAYHDEFTPPPKKPTKIAGGATPILTTAKITQKIAGGNYY
jgi:hypothetical protein